MADLSHPTNPFADADQHLARLLAPDVEEPWFRSLYRNIKETINPPKLPPLEVTSKPVAVKSIWGLYAPDKKNWGYSALAVGTVITLLMTVFSQQITQAVKTGMHLVDTNLAPYVPDMKMKKDQMAGGGGGGDRSPTPASKGKLPKLALKQFVPPEAVIRNEHPKLTMEPTIVAPPD